MSSTVIQPAPGEPAATLLTSDLEHGIAVPCLWNPPSDHNPDYLEVGFDGEVTVRCHGELIGDTNKEPVGDWGHITIKPSDDDAIRVGLHLIWLGLHGTIGLNTPNVAAIADRIRAQIQLLLNGATT